MKKLKLTNPRLVSTATSKTLLRALLIISAAVIYFGGSTPCKAKSLSDDAPEWLRKAAAIPTPANTGTAGAVVLVNEGSFTVDADGKVTRTIRHAVRILTLNGTRAAMGVEVYTTDSEKVRDMEGWMIRPSGSFKHYKKDSVIDMVLNDDDVFNQARQKVIAAKDDAEIGSVFGFESVVESKNIFTQTDWDFQQRYPVVSSKFTMTLPTGWHAEAVTFNHEAITPTVNGSASTWEIHDLPYISEEPDAPETTSLAPRLSVGYFPSDTGHSSISGGVFSNWSDVSRWLSQLQDAQSNPDPAITAKAQALTSGAKTDLEKIAAIASYVQHVHYISIQTGLGRGGGFRPHLASEVFSKNYGDCKDKANLMRAMLKSIGMESYLVSIYLGDQFYVRKEWPSPQQFNHCIIAIKVGGDTKASSVIDFSIGKLLIFDPTDEDTPVGELSAELQNSYALIVAGDSGDLVRMPKTRPEENLLSRQIDASLAGDGSITATVSEASEGLAAIEERRIYKHLDKPNYNKRIERWISFGANGSSVSAVDPRDDQSGDRFNLTVKFSAPNYAQSMQGALLVFKPALVKPRDFVDLSSKNRKYPVVLKSGAYKEEVRVKLPAGFSVDELPDPVKLTAEFGTYTTSYQVKDGVLIFDRSLSVDGGMIPVAKYTMLRDFFGRVYGSDQLPVVLAKK